MKLGDLAKTYYQYEGCVVQPPLAFAPPMLTEVQSIALQGFIDLGAVPIELEKDWEGKIIVSVSYMKCIINIKDDGSWFAFPQNISKILLYKIV